MADFVDKSKVPQATVPRLARYLRVLHRLERDGVPKVSSKELAERLDANAAQIRKDFSYFGEFGVRGVGYEVKFLIGELSKCLGLDAEWRVVICGAGKLGQALARYRVFGEEGFRLTGIFDSSRRVVGTDVDGLVIRSERELTTFTRENDVHIAIITVPAEAAQAVADKAIEGGVKGILNFAPVRLALVEGVFIRQVDLSTELMVVSFYLSQLRR
ncbi:MAG TPA: redox-sensing transcriptional repressor Rex [Thermoleophilia bacterium]|nr:redox-sensing transcriptional repressor Rex [Thermoleophilia bacterium]